MPESLTVIPTHEEARVLEATLVEVFATIERIDAHIAEDQRETALIRAETRKMLAEMKAAR
jgi:galactokinase/mevalonate kinase-like predicted kinase